MSHDQRMIRVLMAGLVIKAGGVDPAAALIGASVGHSVFKGSISKRNAGGADWPLVEIMALEAALGEYPVSRWMAERLPQAGRARDVSSAVADVARETGEAISAALSGGDPAVALREVSEAVLALVRMQALLQGGAGA